MTLVDVEAKLREHRNARLAINVWHNTFTATVTADDGYTESNRWPTLDEAVAQAFARIKLPAKKQTNEGTGP
jgi:hypothetical protein